jgi:hypothetical protein
MRYQTKYLWFPEPTQFPTHGQWWSKRATHWLQTEQCFERRGFRTKHELQNHNGSKPSFSANSIIVFKIIKFSVIISSKYYEYL